MKDAIKTDRINRVLSAFCVMSLLNDWWNDRWQLQKLLPFAFKDWWNDTTLLMTGTYIYRSYFFARINRVELPFALKERGMNSSILFEMNEI